MVLVNCKWRQQDIINNVEALEVDGIQVFKHVKTEGMRIYFDSRVADEVRNMQKSSFLEYMMIMDAIMQIQGWQALAISILPVVNDNVYEGYKYTVCSSAKPMDCQRLLK